MRKLKAVQLLIFCLFLSLVPHLSADTSTEKEGSGLEVRSDPSGADLFLDGARQGRTTFAIDNLSSGDHYLLLSKDGYVDRRIRVSITDGIRLVLFLELEEAKGKVSIQVQPKDTVEDLHFAPLVFIDDEKADLGVNYLGEGFHTVRARAFGYEDQWQTVFIARETYSYLHFSLEKASFRLDGLKVNRRRFNPNNPGLLGQSEISFEVSAPGSAFIQIKNQAGLQVFSKNIGDFTTWNQAISWDGKNEAGKALNDGLYTAYISAEGIEKTIDLQIDESIKIRPASLSLGMGGLLFAPDVQLLPQSSFQLDSSILFGKLYRLNGSFGSPSFSFAARFTPFETWEGLVTAHITPSEADGAENGVTLSVRHTLIAPAAPIPLAAAIALGFGFLSEEGPSPLGSMGGIEISLPLELEATKHLALVASPGLIWTGENSYPSEEFPRALFSGGIAYRANSVVAAGSARSSLCFSSKTNPEWSPLFLGVELHLVPPPSVFSINLSGGTWIDGSDQGYFAGFGLALIY